MIFDADKSKVYISIVKSVDLKSDNIHMLLSLPSTVKYIKHANIFAFTVQLYDFTILYHLLGLTAYQ